MKSFGSYIRQERNKKKWNLTKLAAKLELDSANLSKIENGKREFDEKRLNFISEIFEIPLDVIKQRYYSEKIARIAYDANLEPEIFSLAEKKFNYYTKLNLFNSRIYDIDGSGLKAIDLFCGIGGFRLAMDRFNIKTVLSSDIDSYAKETYQANFGDKPLGDINQISLDSIEDFDILTAGFPCQPFSYAGRNKGFKDKTKGTLFFKILEILEHKRPKMFLLENVKGLKSHQGGETLKIITDSLKKLEYNIHWKIISSLDFGVPQKRERWYCVGFDKSIYYEFPEGKSSNTKLKDIIDLKESNEKLKLSKFELERINYHFKNAKNGDRIKHDSSKYKPETKKGKHGVYSFQKPDGSLRFHVGDRAKTQIQEAFYCCLNTYSPTIIANRVPKLWDIARKLSVSEAKRLQGFPEDFTFPVSDNQSYKQLGNSVTVPVIESILGSMLYFYQKSEK